jgi:hypothetical protein
LTNEGLLACHAPPHEALLARKDAQANAVAVRLAPGEGHADAADVMLKDGLRLFFVRHGETDWNAARRHQGPHDIPINAHGRGKPPAMGTSSGRRWARVRARSITSQAR